MAMDSCSFSQDKDANYNDLSFPKETRSDDLISNANKLFFNFFMDLVKVFAHGLSCIILKALAFLSPLGARLWKPIFLPNDLEIRTSFWTSHQFSLKWFGNLDNE